MAPGASASLPLPTPLLSPGPQPHFHQLPRAEGSVQLLLLVFQPRPNLSPLPASHLSPTVLPCPGWCALGAPPSSRLIHVSGLPLRAPWATQYEEAAQKRTQRNLATDTGHTPLGHLLNPSPFTTKQKRQTGNARLLKITLLLSNRTTVSKMSL